MASDRSGDFGSSRPSRIARVRQQEQEQNIVASSLQVGPPKSHSDWGQEDGDLEDKLRHASVI